MMSSLGITLAWCAVQTTLVTGAALLLLALFRDRQPALNRRMALVGFVLVGALTLAVFSPWPTWLSDVNDSLGTLPAESAARVDPVTRSSPPIAELASQPAAALDPPQTGWLTAAGEFWEEFQATTLSAEVGRDTRATGWATALTILAWVFVAGFLVAVVRIVLGLLHLERLRQHGSELNGTRLNETMDVMQAEMGMARSVALLESSEIDSPLAMGWRQPAVLVPKSWPSWTDQERDVVMAHELAHIAHRDFPLWLSVQILLALHFCHPLMHLLASRLKLAQELTADEAAARWAGGRQAYLRSLAEMALRQADRPHVWAAASFLPTRSSFVRRIEMLRYELPWSATAARWVRWSCVAVLVTAGVAALGLRPPAWAQSNTLSATEETAANQSAASEALSLAHVPTKTIFVMAASPARVQRHAEVRQAIDELSRKGFFRDSLGIEFNELRQISVVVVAGKTGQEPPPPLMIFQAVAATAADKMQAVLMQGAQPEAFGRYTVYHNRHYTVRLNDDTLIYADSQDSIQSYLAHLMDGAQPRWTEAWAQEADGLVAWLMDVQAVRATVIAGMAEGPPEAQAMIGMFSPLWTDTDMISGNLRWTDQLTMQMRGECTSNEGAIRVGDTVQALMTMMRNSLPGAREAAARNPQQAQMMLPMIELVDRLSHDVEPRVQGDQVMVQVALENLEVFQTMTRMVPTVMQARNTARRMQSTNNLRQIALAFHNYHDAYRQFPAAQNVGPDGKTVHSWRVAILPFIEQAQLYDRYRMNEPWDSPHNKKLLAEMPAIYRHPNEAADSTDACYFGITGEGTLFHDKKGARLRDIRDGSSNTIMVIESKQSIPWTKPEDLPFDIDKLAKQLGGFGEGANIALCDGAVQFLDKELKKDVLKALITISGGEVNRLR